MRATNKPTQPRLIVDETDLTFASDYIDKASVAAEDVAYIKNDFVSLLVATESFELSDLFCYEHNARDWFVYYGSWLQTRISSGEYVPNFPYLNAISITPEFLLFLYCYGFLAKFIECQSAECVVNLLMQCGDVERHPGPVVNPPIDQKVLKNLERKQKAQLKQKTQRYLNKKERRAWNRMRKEFFDQKMEQMNVHFEMNTHVLKEVGKNVAYAASNYVAPGVGSALATVVEGTRATKILGDLSCTSDRFRDCVNQVSDDLPHLIQNSNQTVNLAANTIASLGDVVDSLKNKVSDFKMFESLTVNPLHFCIVIILTYVAFSYPSVWTGIPILLLVLYMFEWDAVLINKVKSLCGYHFQMDLPLNLLGQVLFTIIAFCGVGVIPQERWYDSMLRRLDLIPKSCNGVRSIWESAGLVYEAVEKEFKIFFLGYKKEDLTEKETLYTDIKEWADRIAYYWNMPNRNTIAKEVSAVQEVEQMFSKMNHWLHTTSIRKSLPQDVLQIILSLRPQMNELFKLYCRSTVHEGGPRKAPLCVMFSGDSGRGKSELLIPIAYRLLNARGYTDAKQIEKEIYVRNMETEFWDAYVGQKLVLVDDAFQIKDTVSNPSIEFMESIRLVNTAPAQVHCADTNDKGRFFSSEILLYTTNLHHDFMRYINSINCPEAAVNRLNANAFRVHTQPHFEKRVMINGVWEYRLNKELLGWSTQREAAYQARLARNPRAPTLYCRDCKRVCEDNSWDETVFCPHHYMFERYNLLNDQQIGRSLTFNELVQQLIQYDDRSTKRESNKLDFYRKFAENPLMFEMDTDDDEFFDAEILQYASQDETVVDLNDSSNWEMMKLLVRARKEFSNRCDSGIIKDNSIDNWHNFLVQVPELFAFNESLMFKTVIPRKIQEMDSKTLHYWFVTFLAEGFQRQIFTHQVFDHSTIRDKYIEDMDFIGFLAAVNNVKLDLRYIKGGEEFLADFLMDTDKEGRTMQQCLDEFLELKRHRDEATQCELKLQNPSPSYWKVLYNRICLKIKYYKDLIVEYVSSCSIFQMLSFFGIILTFIGLVWKFMPSAESALNSFESAASSADVKMKTNVVKVESSPSSADVKLKTKVTQIESSPSSAEVKLKINTVKVESSPSSSDVKLKHTPVKVESDDDRLTNVRLEGEVIPEGLFDPACHEMIKRVCTRNMYLLHSDKKKYGNVLFITGHTMLINKHYPMLMKFFIENGSLKYDDVLYLSNLSGMRVGELRVRNIIEGHVPLVKQLSDGTTFDTDATLIGLDPVECKVPVVHRNCVKLFLTNSQLSLLSGRYRGVLPSFNNVYNDGKGKECILPMYKYLGNIAGYLDGTHTIDINDFEQHIKYRNFWIYDSSTYPGDCGAPLFIEHSSLSNKLVGIHSAGGQGNGVGQLITQEMLRRALESMPMRYQCSVDIDLLGDFIEHDKEMVGSVPIKDGLFVHGKLKDDMKVVGSSKTKIIPSVLQDEIVPHRTIPTILGKTGDLDPMEKGLRKFGKYTPLIDHRLIHLCGNDVANNLNMNPARLLKENFARVLTYEEAVIGVEDDEFLAPINRKTSLGFPFTYIYDHPDGKKDAFGHDEWTLDTPMARAIKDDVDTLIDNAAQGIQTGVYWTDTLKMERREIAKVKQGKTRVFCAGPVHFTLAFRQYFLGFAAWVMHNRNFNEISTGTNVFSSDWDVIARKILSRAQGKNGSNVGAGDFSNFDGSLSSQILWYILEVINDWYDDGEENEQIRRGLWLNIVNAIHVNHDVVYQCTHSQPSGCPLTAVLNSIYNSIVVRMVYVLIARDHCPTMATMLAFEKVVSMVAYGDDNLIGIHDSIVPWFNMNTISEYFKIIGHEYTDESKSSTFVNVKDLSECGYLKRKFVMDQVVNRHIAPLDVNVILEIPQWTKKGLLGDEILIANIDVSMRELSLHEKDVFDFYAKLFKKKCAEFNIPYRFRTFEEYKTAVLDIPDFEIASDRYLLHVTSTTFDLSSECSQKLVRSGHITSACIRRMSRKHNEGFVKVDHSKKIVHVMTDKLPKLPRYIAHIRKYIANDLLDTRYAPMSEKTRVKIIQNNPNMV